MMFLSHAVHLTRTTLVRHLWLLFALAAIHLAASGAFSAFAGFAARTLFGSTVIDPRAVGWVAHAPLTASLAVIVTMMTFGTNQASAIINARLWVAWLPVTLVLAWAFYVDWFSQSVLTVRMHQLIAQQPQLLGWFEPHLLTDTIPKLARVLAYTLATLSVPVLVARRQPFRHVNALVSTAVVMAVVTVLMITRDQYRAWTNASGEYIWLPQPGFDPAGIAWDRLLVSFSELPFLIPATVVIYCLAASLHAAARKTAQSAADPVPQ